MGHQEALLPEEVPFVLTEENQHLLLQVAAHSLQHLCVPTLPYLDIRLVLADHDGFVVRVALRSVEDAVNQ
eukprot:scaffold8274_cov267-Pinguiococcus_pyrenoidosus.AAC.2